VVYALGFDSDTGLYDVTKANNLDHGPVASDFYIVNTNVLYILDGVSSAIGISIIFIGKRRSELEITMVPSPMGLAATVCLPPPTVTVVFICITRRLRSTKKQATMSFG